MQLTAMEYGPLVELFGNTYQGLEVLPCSISTT